MPRVPGVDRQHLAARAVRALAAGVHPEVLLEYRREIGAASDDLVEHLDRAHDERPVPRAPHHAGRRARRCRPRRCGAESRGSSGSTGSIRRIRRGGRYRERRGGGSPRDPVQPAGRGGCRFPRSRCGSRPRSSARREARLRRTKPRPPSSSPSIASKVPAHPREGKVVAGNREEVRPALRRRRRPPPRAPPPSRRRGRGPSRFGRPSGRRATRRGRRGRWSAARAWGAPGRLVGADPDLTERLGPVPRVEREAGRDPACGVPEATGDGTLRVPGDGGPALVRVGADLPAREEAGRGGSRRARRPSARPRRPRR